MSTALTRSPLSRRLALQIGGAFVLACGLVVAAWLWMSRGALAQEHEAASLRMARLFEASLKQAMLKRDLAGLDALLAELGHLPGLADAALLNVQGEVRFASDTQRRLRDESAALAGLCLQAGCGTPSGPRLQWQERETQEVLRVAYPVRNEARCQGCHGSAAAHPVNGVLLLDFSPMSAARQMREQTNTWLLPGLLGLLLLLSAAIAWVLRREVLRPVSALAGTVSHLAAGDLSRRTGAAGSDELAQLARGVDHMAEQVQAHLQALRTQGRFLQDLIDASPDPVVVIGQDHRIVLANRAYAEMLGQAQPALPGQTCYRAGRARQEPCPSTLVCCPVAECPRNGPQRTLMSMTRADGTAVDVEIHAAALAGPDGAPLVVEVMRRLDQDLRFSQEQRLSSLGLLASGVAHEIHNPLASIRLALQTALRGMRSGAPPEELRDYLQLVDAEIDRCVQITQRLLRLSQPSATLDQPVTVRSAVDDVLGLVGEEARQGAVTVRAEVEPPGLRAWMDEAELRQVLLNLVQNALHAMPDGGLLRVSARAAEAGEVQLDVEDSGVGIALEDQPLVFLPFFSRRADGRRGTGLGLALCKAMVEQRGGRIELSSSPGKGSRFRVHLRAVDPSDPNPA